MKRDGKKLGFLSKKTTREKERETKRLVLENEEDEESYLRKERKIERERESIISYQRRKKRKDEGRKDEGRKTRFKK